MFLYEHLGKMDDENYVASICVNLIYMKRTDTYWERT